MRKLLELTAVPSNSLKEIILPEILSEFTKKYLMRK